MAGTFQSPGKNALANGIAKAYVTGTGAAVTYELVATVGATIDTDSRTAVTFGTPNTGVINITEAAGGGGDVTMTIASGKTITNVYLVETGETSLGNAYCYDTLETDNVFTNGGDLIVTSFEIKVS